MFQDSNTKELSKTGGKPLFCKAPVLCTAVSKAIHRHPANKLAAADVLLSTALAGLTLQKRKNNKNLPSTITLKALRAFQDPRFRFQVFTEHREV